MNVLIYALGGGLGHLTRATALARALARNGVEVTALTNSPFASLISDEALDLVRIPPELDGTTVRERVLAELARRDFDLLVVDTFPRGLAGELACVIESLDVPAALVHRDIAPRYVERFDLAAFVERYALLLVPGESAPLSGAPNALVTRPWLVRDAHELLNRKDARERLGVEDSAPLAVVVGSGKYAEIDEARKIADRLERELAGAAIVKLVSPRDESHWPLLELHAGIDVVVGSGGYNTVNECRATGTPLVALPRRRLYDRQSRRLDAVERVDDVREIAPRVREILRAPKTADAAPTYANGASAAVRAIREVLDSARRSVSSTFARMTSW